LIAKLLVPKLSIEEKELERDRKAGEESGRGINYIKIGIVHF